MLTDAEITSAASRLVAGTAGSHGKLSESDVDSLVSIFRLVLGPLEDQYGYDLYADLEALDDTENTKKKAAKLAACLLRLIDEDFGVARIVKGIENDDEDQRRLFTIYALSILYKIPVELSENYVFDRINLLSRRYAQSVRTTFSS